MKFEIDGIRFKTSGSVEGFSDNVAKQISYSICESGSAGFERRGFILDLDAPNTASFIGWNDLSEQNVIGWVTQSLGTEKLEQMQGWLDNALERKGKPVVKYAAKDELPF